MSSLETGLTGKVVIITGASSGIGRSTAIEFAKNGCRLVITGRNEETLNETANLCLFDGKMVEMVKLTASLENEDDCKKIIEETIKKFGQIDVLVNSAGILTRGSIEELSLEDYDKIMNLNTRTVFILMKAAIPYLKITKGNIVNVSSLMGLRSFPGVLAYNVSKAALDQLTRCVALEVASDGIRVNSVNPGVIVTNILRNAGLDEEAYTKFLEHTKECHALGRVGNVEEVAKPIVFLASDLLAGFMTGVTLSIDGGRAIMCPR